jgi:predicted DNA-binding transcriptional regulator AlpA
MMDHYTFTLNFTVPGRDGNPEQYLDALYEAGCDDAAVGVGQNGMIGLDFTREATSAEDAIRSAVENVRAAITGAALIQAGPDLVGLTEMAMIFGFSRQNMRKYATGQSGGPAAFPLPVVLGEPSLWHLAEIVAWLKDNSTVQPPEHVFEVSQTTAKLNFEVEKTRLRRILALS